MTRVEELLLKANTPPVIPAVPISDEVLAHLQVLSHRAAERCDELMATLRKES